MGNKDGQQDTCNYLPGANAKRKRAYKLAKRISAVAFSKRQKLEKARADQVDSGLSASSGTSSNNAISEVVEEEAECFENVSSKVLGSFSRFLYYEKGEWLDFSRDATAVLFENLRSGETVADVLVCGCMCLVNFVLMVQIITATGYRRSIAWIDETGNSFFPSMPFEDWSFKPKDKALHGEACKSGGSEGLQLPAAFDPKRIISKNRSICLDRGYEETSSHLIQKPSPCFNEENESDPKSVITCHFLWKENLLKEGSQTFPAACTYPGLGNKLVQLDEADERFTLIKAKFLEGLGILQKGAFIKSIYFDSHSQPFSQTRLLAFHRQLDIIKQLRGDPNVQYAWHGTSKGGVCGIVLHGFGQAMKPSNGAAYGIGVYLAPECYSYVSAIYSDNDENSEQHVVLCKVIMGNVELVQHGSEQYHPSSEEFDTGVDNIEKPKRYIVWSTHMNAHILPLYVVNFKLSPECHELLSALKGKHMMVNHSIDANCTDYNHIRLQAQQDLSRGLKAPSISFPLLLSVLKSKLPEMIMLILQRQYLCFKARQISKLELLNTFRRLVGDGKLRHAIMSMKEQDLRS